MKTNLAQTAWHDSRNNFKELYNPNTGFYFRTGILKNNTIDTGIDPFMRSIPSLIDIGIMGTCSHGASGLCIRSGVECYQDGLSAREKNMPLENFKKIIDQVKGKTFQCALGGRGDPNKHEHFEEILEYSRRNSVTPTYTTSGLALTDNEAAITAKYAGAAAVSFYRNRYTYEAIDKLIRKGVKTNIHYVLSKNSIADATHRLRENLFPQRINAIIFLLHKPVGQGTRSNVLTTESSILKRFFDQAVGRKYPFKIGFDSCTVPGLLNYAPAIEPASIEPCEGGRFSCYISAGMKMTPCSFDRKMKYGVDLNQNTIEEAWNSNRFKKFRSILQRSCPKCDKKRNCMGGCPLRPEVTLCENKTGGY
ncbi:MAG: radical SAM protein [bacterium]|nr:radical SAM protein [bacterium]